jgi:hypothetical protein
VRIIILSGEGLYLEKVEKSGWIKSISGPGGGAAVVVSVIDANYYYYYYLPKEDIKLERNGVRERPWDCVR